MYGLVSFLPGHLCLRTRTTALQGGRQTTPLWGTPEHLTLGVGGGPGEQVRPAGGLLEHSPEEPGRQVRVGWWVGL